MTAAELDALDRECAEWMGWTKVTRLTAFSVGMPPSEKPLTRIPSPTRDWTAFGELLLALGERGFYPSVHLSRMGDEREGAIRVKDGKHSLAKEREDDPRVALCMAVAALGKSGA